MKIDNQYKNANYYFKLFEFTIIEIKIKNQKWLLIKYKNC